MARDGEIVIALVENEATCKRIFREAERVRLQPANSSMEPIYVHASDFRETMIIGTVVGVFSSDNDYLNEKQVLKVSNLRLETAIA